MKKKIMAFLPVLLWMGVIFLMSAQTGDVSGEESGKITELVLALLAKLTGGRFVPDVDLMHLLVRKAAHMTEYAVLFLLSRNAFAKCGAKHPVLYALALSILYAASDEYHQGFTEGRGPSAFDVLIDTCGALLAALAHRLFSAVKGNVVNG